MIIVIVIIILFSRELGRSTDIALPIHSSTKKATSKVSRGARDGSAPIAPPPLHNNNKERKAKHTNTL
jgi:hypothetical protein